MLFPQLIEARTYAERMFQIILLDRLDDKASAEAITTPIAGMKGAPEFAPQAVYSIQSVSAGYPYFIQFICREAFDVFLQQASRGEDLSAPLSAIVQKLDKNFFSGRWDNATDRQRELMHVIAELPNASDVFTVNDIVQASNAADGIRPFSSSHVNQLLAALARAGLVYKTGYGKYGFAVPLMADFIKRQR
jgi:hypothetical protein